MTTTLTPPEQHPTEQPPTAPPPPTYGPSPGGPAQWVPQPPPKRFRGLAITGLVLGIIGVVFALTPVTFLVAFPLGILGVIFGAIGFRHGMGKAGAILGAIAIVLGIVWSAAWSNAFNDASNDLNTGQQGGVSQGIGTNDAAGDVEIGRLQVDNSYGVASYTVPVTITNNSSERSDYWITVALESADGSRQIDTANVFIENLEPGQTKHASGEFYSAENVPQNARLVLQEVQRTASV